MDLEDITLSEISSLRERQILRDSVYTRNLKYSNSCNHSVQRQLPRAWWGGGGWEITEQRAQSFSSARGETSRDLPYDTMPIVNNTVLYT